MLGKREGEGEKEKGRERKRRGGGGLRKRVAKGERCVPEKIVINMGCSVSSLIK